MFSASSSKSLLRLFGETLSFETPASTQATICPLQVPEWLPQEDLSYITPLVCGGQLKIHGPFFRRMMETSFAPLKLVYFASAIYPWRPLESSRLPPFSTSYKTSCPAAKKLGAYGSKKSFVYHWPPPHEASSS
jgi:hypothetical protein